MPLNPPPSQPAKWWISSWISIKRASNRIANTQPKLWTNPPKIANKNKQNYEQTGVSENDLNSERKKEDFANPLLTAMFPLLLPLKHKEYSKNSSPGKEFPSQRGNKLLRTSFWCCYHSPQNITQLIWKSSQSDSGYMLALFRSLCDKRQLSRKNKFDKLSGMFPALVFVALWAQNFA